MRARLVGCSVAVVQGHQRVSQFMLRVPRVLLGKRVEAFQVVRRGIRGQLKVAVDQIVGDGQRLAVHLFRRLVDADVVIQ